MNNWKSYGAFQILWGALEPKSFFFFSKLNNKQKPSHLNN